VGNKKVVYITGCFGFIGSHVVRACLEKVGMFMGVDKMTYAYFPDAYDEFIEHPRFSFEKRYKRFRIFT
jgi:dTDP-D-glucose 4,6-dehydratase